MNVRALRGLLSATAVVLCEGLFPLPALALTEVQFGNMIYTLPSIHTQTVDVYYIQSVLGGPLIAWSEDWLIPPIYVGVGYMRTTEYLFDPTSQTVLSGRVTFQYGTGDRVVSAGWIGEFGMDAGLAAPIVGQESNWKLASPQAGVFNLQPTASAGMLSSSIKDIPQDHEIVFSFDWGSGGLLPTRNLNDDGAFYFAGLALLAENGAPEGSLVGSPELVGSSGTGAPTYIRCRNPRGEEYFCGTTSPVPEPATWLMLLAGLAFLFRSGRRIDSSGFRVASNAHSAG